MHLLRSLLIGTIMAGSLSAAVADDVGPVYEHNGSLLRVVWGDGDSMRLVYVRPRGGLGVSPGTVLFRGTIAANDHISGEAKIFKSGCGPVWYEVSGRFDGDYFSLSGPAPIRRGCSVVGYDWNHNSILEFIYRHD